MPEVLEKINYWIKNEFQKGHWIIVTGMHGTVEACKHTDFKYIVDQADMWVPDGISLVWVARLKGFDIRERISGADLMLEVFKKDYRNFLYGDTEETLLAVKNKFSNSKIETFSPPFRELTKEEDDEIIKKINEAKPDILWVALGLPKQEKWIFSHRDKLRVPVVVGVGAAFKFLSGKVKRAPKWIGSLGFEWLWRLFAEPKVVWKRVFIDMPYFFWLVVKDLFSW
jgi:N-acetylglucosaminyldiphosphoundecaprenol N-acetyl-beta-D-mannosaminyltransferase